MPVHADGPVSVSASWTRNPTAPANETKDTTYEMKSQSFTLQFSALNCHRAKGSKSYVNHSAVVVHERQCLFKHRQTSHFIVVPLICAREKISRLWAWLVEFQNLLNQTQVMPKKFGYQLVHNQEFGIANVFSQIHGKLLETSKGISCHIFALY